MAAFMGQANKQLDNANGFELKAVFVTYNTQAQAKACRAGCPRRESRAVMVYENTCNSIARQFLHPHAVCGHARPITLVEQVWVCGCRRCNISMLLRMLALRMPAATVSRWQCCRKSTWWWS